MRIERVKINTRQLKRLNMGKSKCDFSNSPENLDINEDPKRDIHGSNLQGK